MSESAIATSVSELMPRALADLAELVAIPSVADPRQFPPERCVEAAEWVRDAFGEVGVPSELVLTPDGTHTVVGHRPGPDGAPTVLLYAHYDVQPPQDEAAWISPPFELTEREGRFYGRGSADCKGNIVAHLTALRALQESGHELGVGLRIVVEGSEEQGTGGLEHYLQANPDALPADVVLVVDTGNVELGRPTLTTSLRGGADVVVRVEALQGEVHSGAFGGAAPDALAALIRLLGTLHAPDGDATIDGLDATGTWDGADYDPTRFRADAGVLDGVELLGSGRISDALWARPAVTVTGIDAPAVVGSANAVQPRAGARINLRVPPGTDAHAAQQALVDHLHAHAPWGVRVTTEVETPGQPFRARTDGPAFAVLSQALADAFGEPAVTSGSGGSIPLCNVFEAVNPSAEIVLMGVEEPACQIHAPNESVAPSEIQGIALGEALFLARLGAPTA